MSAAICSSTQFQSISPDYRLPQFAFLFAETLLWFAQAARSGVWTYYEATSQSRQETMVAGLREAAPEGFALWCEQGMRDWRDKTRIGAVDNWMAANDDVANEWLRDRVMRNRETLLELTAK